MAATASLYLNEGEQYEGHIWTGGNSALVTVEVGNTQMQMHAANIEQAEQLVQVLGELSDQLASHVMKLAREGSA